MKKITLIIMIIVTISCSLYFLVPVTNIKNVFIGLLIQDVVIIAISVMFAFFAENKVIGLKIFMTILAICVFALSFDVVCSILFLKKRESKFMAKALKGE